MTLSHEPVLSVELFQTIIDILGEHSPSVHEEPHLAKERSADLVECALVCKTFAQMCRPHIFSHVHSVMFVGPQKRQLLSFFDHVTRNPDALRLVRMLTIDTFTDYGDDDEGPTIDEEKFQQILSVFCSFPNLQFLDINEYEYYLGKPNDSKDIRLRLLRTYLPQGTLRTLHIDRLPYDISPTSVVTTPGLRQLSYRQNHGELVIESSDVFSDLEELLVSGGSPDFPIDFLDHCPHLQHLSIPDSTSFTKGSIPAHAFDPSILKTLKLRDIPVFHEFCQIRHRQRDGRRIYQDLEDVELELVDEPSIEKARELLSNTPSLRTLNAHVFPRESFFNLPDLGLERSFMDGTFKNLVCLDLTYTALPGAEGYEESISSMQLVIATAAGCNVLERIHVFLQFGRIPVKSILALSEPPFPAIDTITVTLRDGNRYPSLKEAELSFSFELPSDTPDGNGYPSYSRILIQGGVVILDGIDRRSLE